jgi:hydrogenase-4 membrane subunit HyfE
VSTLIHYRGTVLSVGNANTLSASVSRHGLIIWGIRIVLYRLLLLVWLVQQCFWL